MRILISGESFWQATVGLLLLAQTAPRCNSKATQMLPKVYLDEGEFPGVKDARGRDRAPFRPRSDDARGATRFS